MPRPKGKKCQSELGNYDSLYEMNCHRLNPQLQRNQSLTFKAVKTESYKPDFLLMDWVIETKAVTDSTWRGKIFRILNQNPSLRKRYLLVLMKPNVPINGKGGQSHEEWCQKYRIQYLVWNPLRPNQLIDEIGRLEFIERYQVTLSGNTP